MQRFESLAHETGYNSGLRHFFAQLSKNKWPSEIFGEHNEFSIIYWDNYNLMFHGSGSET